MKSINFILKNIAFLFLIVVTLCTPFKNLKAQTGYCTVLQQPCDSDGVLVTIITSGLTPPLTFYYDNETHSNVLNYADTLYNISGSIDGVSVTDNLGNYLYINSGIVPPFTIDFPIITNPVCPNTTGTVQITINGGNSPSNVSWYQGTYTPGLFIGNGNPMNFQSGDYFAYVSDINGCGYFYIDNTDSFPSISINQISPVNFNVNTTDANCTNGTATISNIIGGIPPYSFLWTNGANTSSIGNLTSGYNYATVTDAQGCHTTQWFYINQSTIINVNSTVTNATCLNNNGSVISFGSGGTPPYTYLYSNGTTTQTSGGLLGNSYLNVTVTDANGCTGYNYFNIGTNTPIVVNYTTTPCSCTSSTGSAALNISGGTLPYSVIWYTTPQQTGNSISNMAAGNYSFKVTDAVGCVRTGTVTIPPQSSFYGNPSAIYPICPINNLSFPRKNNSFL